MERDGRLAEAIPTRLTTAEGRKFGLTVGIAFLLLGGVSRWRGHDMVPLVLWSLGGALTLGGLLVPSLLGPVYRAWMKLALLLSKVTTPIFMGAVYFLVITPMGALMRLVGRNPLKRHAAGSGYWIAREPRSDQSESLRRQF